MLSKFKRNALTVISVRVGSALGTFAFASLMSYLLPKEEYGAVALLMTVVVFVGIIFSFGQRDLVIREVSKLLSSEKEGAAYAFSERAVLWALTGGLIGGLLMSIGFFIRGESLIFCACAGLLVILLSVNHTWAGCGTARKRFFWAIAPRDLFWRILVILIAGAVFFTHDKTPLDRNQTALIILLVFIALIIAQKTMLGANVAPLRLSGIEPAPELRRPSLNFCLNSLSGLGFVTLDVAVVGIMLGDAQAAEYYPANRLALFALFFYMALATVINPDLSRQYAKGDIQGVQRLASIGAVLASIPSVCFVGMVWLGQDYIYDLFATASHTTVLCTLILSCGQLICCLIGYSGESLMMGGYDKKVARVTMGCAISAAICLPLATYNFGILGTAITMTSLILLREFILYVMCIRIIGIRSDLFSALWILLLRGQK